MLTPEEQAQELQENVQVINPSPRQLSVIINVTNDKKILQDRMDEVSKREKDIVNLILDANNVDPLTAKEIRMEDNKLIVIKHTPIGKGIKGLPNIPKVPTLPKDNGAVEKVEQK